MIIVPKCAIFNGYALDFATLNPASNAIQGNVVWFGKLVSRHLGTGVSNRFFMLPLFIETTSLQITSSNFYSSSDPPLFKVQLNSRVVNTFSTNFYLENSRFILVIFRKLEKLTSEESSQKIRFLTSPWSLKRAVALCLNKQISKFLTSIFESKV